MMTLPALGVALPSADRIHQVAGLVAFALALVVVWYLERGGHDWGEHLRTRFVLGVPWGSLLSVGGVVLFYLVAQHGFAHWYDPVTLPYRSWSYFYPLGVLTAAFAHAGSAHLIGNVTAALVVFPICEYAVGHYPRERGSQSFGSPLTNPILRAVVLLPAGVFVVGILTALFSWGPVIGFSGVVFAGFGFAVVRYPLAAVVALVAQNVVVLVYRVLLNPIVVREASERYVRPGWAGIAVQGHALGVFLGVVAGILVFYRGDLLSLPRVGDRREDPPSPLRLWFATLLLSLSLGLHLLWWYRGADVYVLYRAAGLAFATLVSLLVVVGVTTSDRPTVGRWFVAAGARAARPDGNPLESFDTVTNRQVATVFVLVPLLVMAGVAVPVNALTVADDAVPDGAETVSVNGYDVTYAEDAPNRMVSVVDTSAFGESTQVNASGVIVVSESRNVWVQAVSKGELASRGSVEVVLGGPAWRETVFVKREGWSALGGGAAYRVRIGPQRGDTRVAYTSGNATAGPVVAGRNLSIAPAERGFRIRVGRSGTRLGEVRVPRGNETVRAGGITFVRDGRTVEARANGTRVDVFRAGD
jgi:membrane associated rhomboid family serine protease